MLSQENEISVFHRTLFSVLSGILLCMLCCGAIEAEPGQTEESPDQKMMTFVLASMRSNWDRLQTGEYNCYGKQRISSDPRKRVKEDPKTEGAPARYIWGRHFDDELTFYSAFDFPHSRMRFDRTERRIFPEKAADQPSTDSVSQTVRFSQTRDARTFWNSRGKAIVVEPLGSEIDGSYEPIIDIRTLPVAYYRQLQNLGLPFAEWWSRVTNRKKLLDAVLDEGGRYRLRWGPAGAKDGDELFESYTIWFDSKRSCVPVRMEVAVNVPRAKPSVVTETTWTEFNGIWLPSSYHAISFFIPNHYELHLSFDWKAVNQEIDADIFSWKGFDAPKGTRVLDARVSKERPLRIAQIGASERKPTVVVHHKEEDGWSIRFVLLSLNAIIILAVCLFIWWRRVRKKRSR